MKAQENLVKPDELHAGVLESLCNMYRDMLGKGALATRMIETSYGIEQGELETWVNAKIELVQAKVRNLQSGSTTVQSVGRASTKR